MLGTAKAIWIIGLLVAALNFWMFLAFDAVSSEASSAGDIGMWGVGFLALSALAAHLWRKPMIAAGLMLPQLVVATLTWLPATIGDFAS